MNVGLRTRQHLGRALRTLPRCYTTETTPAAAATTPATTPADLLSPADLPLPVYPDPATRPVVRGEYHVLAATVLSRPPILTPDLTDFEASFYFYQRRLNQKLALPFTRYFYFKDKSPADLEWKRKQNEAAYTGFGKRGWADELLVGDDRHKEADFGYRRLVDTTVTGEDASAEEGVAVTVDDKKKILELPVGRITKADVEQDLRSLDRAGSRTLYLLVKQKERPKWRFPETQLIGRESLREGAERALAEAAGVNMNTWFVGNVPIGHRVHVYPATYKGNGNSEKIFFMKARIMTGQANIQNNKQDLEDFVWLSKDQIAKYTGTDYYSSIADMLVAR